jgi:glycosyltransferase involved in cell wall biosynthesis
MKLALILNTCNQPDALSRVLWHVAAQTRKPDEVVLADDGSTDETRNLFKGWGDLQAFPCRHAWQENKGFRRSRILNLAIAQTRADYLVFLDGDTVPHPRFIEDHHAMAREGAFVQGHRALTKERAAKWFGQASYRGDVAKAFFNFELSGVKNAFRWPWPAVQDRTDLRGVRGCNLAIWRRDLVAVNGYNEAFTGWGREDSELAVRLMNSGVRRLDIRGRFACCHLWHPPASRQSLPANDGELEAARREGRKRCVSGLDGHASP